ncbi:GIY-YIG nuclease family protein [Fibrobacter sp. UWR2]|uniref:GIY-YIG nuclease family protein n=1 Tax=Fibrobacter sp. UWR2 TaxID=1964352 RepID=UPI0011826FAD
MTNHYVRFTAGTTSMQNKSYTYILTNNNGKVMYIGVTADLFKKLEEGNPIGNLPISSL